MKDLLKAIIRIPHLDLGLEFDPAPMQEEVKQITDWVSYEAHAEDYAIKHRYREIWKGRTLFSHTGSSYDGIKGYGSKAQRESPPPLITDLGLKMPFTVEALKSFDAHKKMVRIMKITAGTGLAWHSHVLKYGQPLDLLVGHLPIVIPKEFKYQVIHRNYLVGETATDPSKIVSKWYPPGRVHIFNCFHEHRVHNSGTEDRISLMLFLPLTNPIIYELVKKAVNNYDGPLIEE
jgi:hypothetical protein